MRNPTPIPAADATGPRHQPFLVISGLVPAVAVQSRNDFPLFQAPVLLAGPSFLVISGLVTGMTKIWDRQAVSRTGH